MGARGTRCHAAHRNLPAVRPWLDVGGYAALPRVRAGAAWVLAEGEEVVVDKDVKHQSTLPHEGSIYALLVHHNGGALVAEVDAETQQTVFMRFVEPHEDGLDIALAGVPRTWFDRELAVGRS